MDAVGGVGSPESGGSAAAAVVIDFPGAGGETAAVRIPRRIQKRLLESRGSPPSSVEEIEAKLKEANLRRQQFHEWLSSKARPKPRSPSWSSQEEDLGQRLEAKLYAAEQKRLSLLAKAQMKLARLDELRKAAKTGVAMRFEREREELGTKVESRVQKAEANRTRLMKAHMQRRAAAQERKTRSLLQRVIRETKYKECVNSSILEKRAAAEKKRMGLLEAEKIRARARVIQAHRIAKTVCHQRESERRKTKEQLENRLQKARRQRAEYLKQRGSSHIPARGSQNKLGDLLSRKLARCWRQFVMSRRTTFSLAKAYEALEINEKVVKHMPFEQLALRIESSITLQTVKALLDRLETRFLLSQFSGSSRAESIDHLLKRLATPKKRATPSRISRSRGSTKKVSKDLRISAANKLTRYPERVVLCAYMILGHPNAVFSGQGEPEVTLRESAAEFVREFELLIRIILDGPRRQVSTDALSDEQDHQQETSQLSCRSTFRSRLDAFDAAWRSYLYRFVVWKVKDARSLEEDLVRAACQLEFSMMQTCKLTPEGQACNLSHDMRAIQKQVTEDQNLLREKVRHLSGDAGFERMECALSDTRSKYYEAIEQGSPMVGLVTHISSPTISNSSASLSGPLSEKRLQQSKGNSSRVVRSLFGNSSTVPGTESQDVEAQSTPGMGKVKRPVIENELFVNEIVHEGCGTFTNTRHEEDVDGIKAKVKETLEKAFWDAILESVKRDEPNYDQIVGLVKEVRDELCEMAPHSWKQEIFDSIDLDILSQVLESGTWDTDYLRKILEYALVLLQKLTSPANEDEMKRAHKELLEDLENSARSDGKGSSSFALSTIKGLRFVLEQIQALKKEISKARIQLMEPIIKGSAGFEYLQKAFADRYGPPSAAANSLPKTVQWISTLSDNLEGEWNEHINSLSLLPINNGLSLVGTLRTGGSTVPLASKQSSHLVNASAGSGEQSECKGEKVDRLVRLGLLKLASGIEGLTVDTVPETFELNTTRLRAVQSQLQQIIVISTSLLVFRQIVASENPALAQSELETTISDSAKRLSDLLDRVPEVGIEEIVQTVSGPSSEVALLRGRKEVMTRLLSKSLRSDDAVFSKVSRAIEVAARGVVLGGSGPRGCRLADAALRRVGAGMLLDRAVKTGEALVAMADISVRVHGPWYGCLI